MSGLFIALFIAETMRVIIWPVIIFEKKVLLFIKSPPHNLRQVESFLKKRNFDVYVESDIKAAVSKIIEMRPNFIFLALDHTNPAIANLPKLIAQASSATIVPYILSDKKSDVRKFDLSELGPKLYPPVSGPAIERLVLKYGKHVLSASSEYKQMAINNHKNNSPSNTEDNLLSQTEKSATENINEYSNPKDNQKQQQNDTRFYYSSIQKRNEILRNSQKSKLSSTATGQLKNTLQSKIKIPLESLLNALTESQETNNEPSIEPSKIKAYYLSIYSDEWCGYLMITTQAELEFSTIDLIFSDWIKLQFNNLQEIDECDFFECTDTDSNMIQSLNENAEYFESLKINNYSLSVSFFSIDPSRMTLELNAEKNLITISTDDIPAETELNFSLHLHLPENKKYLMYLQANKKFSHEQQKRLLSNKVMMLYTPIEFEKEYRKFIFKKNIKDIYENINQKKSVI